MSNTQAKCDRCDGPMLLEEVNTQNGFVEIDYCPSCQWSPVVNPDSQKKLIARLKARCEVLRHELEQQRNAWVKMSRQDGFADVMIRRAEDALREEGLSDEI